MDGIGTRLEETPARLAGIDQGLRAGLADLGREMRAELRSIEAHRVRTEARCKYFSHSLRGEFNERIDVLVSGIAHDLTRWFTMVEEYGESQNAIARRLDDAIAQMGRLEGLAEAHVAALRAVECHVDGLRRQIDSCHWTSRWTRVVAWLRSIGSRIR
jgi:flagellar biosynthesis regulator FlaF